MCDVESECPVDLGVIVAPDEALKGLQEVRQNLVRDRLDFHSVKQPFDDSWGEMLVMKFSKKTKRILSRAHVHTHSKKAPAVELMELAHNSKRIKLFIVQLLRVGRRLPPCVEVDQKNTIRQGIDDK